MSETVSEKSLVIETIIGLGITFYLQKDLERPEAEFWVN